MSAGVTKRDATVAARLRRVHGVSMVSAQHGFCTQGGDDAQSDNKEMFTRPFTTGVNLKKHSVERR